MIVELELHKKLIIKRLEFVTEKIKKELAGERFSMSNFKSSFNSNEYNFINENEIITLNQQKASVKQKNDDTLQVSSIATIAEKIRNNALLEMGVPRGYIVTSGDTHEVGIPQGEGNKIVNKRIEDLKMKVLSLITMTTLIKIMMK